MQYAIHGPIYMKRRSVCICIYITNVISGVRVVCVL